MRTSYEIVFRWKGEYCEMRKMVYYCNLTLMDRPQWQIGFNNMTLGCRNENHAWELFRALEQCTEITDYN